MRPGDSVAVLGLGPVGLCAVQVAIAAGATPVLAIDTVPQRLEMARSFGAVPIHLTDESPREIVQAATGGRGVDVGDRRRRRTPTRSTWRSGSRARPAPWSRIGVYAERVPGPHGPRLDQGDRRSAAGQANVIGHVDRVLGMLAAGTLDPTPLVTSTALRDAPEAYGATIAAKR